MHMVQSSPGPSVLSGRQHGSFGSLVLLSPQVKVALWFRLGGVVVDVVLSVPYNQDSSVQTSEGPHFILLVPHLLWSSKFLSLCIKVNCLVCVSWDSSLPFVLLYTQVGSGLAYT